MNDENQGQPLIPEIPSSSIPSSDSSPGGGEVMWVAEDGCIFQGARRVSYEIGLNTARLIAESHNETVASLSRQLAEAREALLLEFNGHCSDMKRAAELRAVVEKKDEALFIIANRGDESQSHEQCGTECDACVADNALALKPSPSVTQREESKDVGEKEP